MDHPLQIYEFGPFRLDAGERLLIKDGLHVPLSPKSFEILCVLVRRSGHLVTKEEILREVWPDSFIEESNLARNVYVLRKTLGCGIEGQSYIKTVPRKGYRFVADVVVPAPKIDEPVAPIEAEPPIKTKPAPIGRRFYLIAALVLLCIASALYFFQTRRKNNPPSAVRSLAVLPFKAIDPHPSDEQAGLGIADSIVVRLSRLPEVSVLPTTSIFKFSGTDRDPVAAGRELGVEAVLDGTLQRSEGRLRISVQLIRTVDGRTLWASTFDETSGDVFALQDSISERIAVTVIPQIGGGTLEGHAPRFSRNAEANESYLMGFYFWNRRNKESVAKAIPYLQKAVEQDPTFAMAHAILADCHFIDAYYGYNIFPQQESYTRARAGALKALELDQTNAEAHIVMAEIKSGVDGDEAAAEAEYRLGLALKPNYTTGHLRYAFQLYFSARTDEALREAKRGQELDPLSPAANTTLAFMLVMTRDFDGAIKFGRRAVELNPKLTVAVNNLGEAYIHKGMYDEALDVFRQLSEDDPLLGQQGIVRLRARAGETKEARALFLQLKRSSDARRLTLLDLASLHTSLGETDQAFKLLEQASIDMVGLASLRFDPAWDALRTDQRFGAILNRGTSSAK